MDVVTLKHAAGQSCRQEFLRVLEIVKRLHPSAHVHHCLGKRANRYRTKSYGREVGDCGKEICAGRSGFSLEDNAACFTFARKGNSNTQSIEKDLTAVKKILEAMSGHPQADEWRQTIKRLRPLKHA
jgi:hypothetical protein